MSPAHETLARDRLSTRNGRDLKVFQLAGLRLCLGAIVTGHLLTQMT